MSIDQNDGYLNTDIQRVQSLETARFMSRVYTWMTAGVALTGFISFYIGTTEELLMGILQNPVLYWGLIISELVAVLSFSFLLPRMNSFVASAVYILYAALTGATLSVIFYVYTKQSLAQVFAITSFAFAGLSGFGYATKRDLGPVGSFCAMGLFGMIGWGLLSLFFPSLMAGALSPTYSVIGIIVFSGLTAYDTQKIKSLSRIGAEGSEESRKGAIHGALVLYLDFINLFLSLLRLMGQRR